NPGPAPGGGVTIAGFSGGAGAQGVGVTNHAGQIWTQSVSGLWLLHPGCGHDISGNLRLWVVGCNPVPGGFGIYQEVPCCTRPDGWVELRGGAVSIGVNPRDDAWATNDVGQIYHWNGSVWVHVPGCGHNIDVGIDGSVWVIGCNPVPGGFGIYRLNGTGWVQE